VRDIIIPLFQLIRDGFYVALFAYGINRMSAYATRRLEVYGQYGDLFPSREHEGFVEDDEEIILKRGSRDAHGNEKRIGFVSVTESVTTPGGAGDTGEVTAPDEDTPKRTRKR